MEAKQALEVLEVSQDVSQDGNLSLWQVVLQLQSLHLSAWPLDLELSFLVEGWRSA